MNITQKDFAASLRDSLARHRCPGASVSIFNDGEWFTAVAGVANVNTGVQITTDTVMHIHSITKVFTATLLMQLVDEGLVDLDAPVVRYLPELKLRDRVALERITVRMLVNHTSGIDGDMVRDLGHDEEAIEKGVARFAALGQLFAPGTECSYSNAATVIAGYLTQQLRGRSWHQLVKDSIFVPLGMSRAVSLPEDALLHRASVGHFVGDSGMPVRTSCAFLPLSFAPAGTSLMMAAKDLVIFAQAHMRGGLGENGVRILSARSAEAMQQITINTDGRGYTYNGGVGIGWMVAGDGLIHHGGGGVGNVSMLYVHPKRNCAAAILTNSSIGYRVIYDVLDPWLSELGTRNPFDVISECGVTPQVDVDIWRYEGLYEDMLHRYLVVPSGRGLALLKQAKIAFDDSVSVGSSAPIPLVPLGNEKFLIESGLEEGSGSSHALVRIFAFSGTDIQGRALYLGNSLRLYPRVAQS